MLTVVTGAAGFIGRTLAARMAATGYPGTIRLVDRVAPPLPSPAFEARIADLAEHGAWPAIVDYADVVIHLAALPGGAAESDPTASRRINLDASLDLIDRLAARATPARLVYASSIAVFGPGLPSRVNDATPPSPVMTYGTHKAMVELALADAVRRGGIDAVALRLPGIVARPRAPGGLKSAFMSDVFHAVRAGEDHVLPVGPDATLWLLSAIAAADALLHAARLAAAPPVAGAITLPALRVRMVDLVVAIAAQGGRDAARVAYRSDPAIEAQFGRMPALATPIADALGFIHDGDLETLTARAMPS